MNIRRINLIAPRTLSEEITPLDRLGNNEIVVEVVACGVCSSELPVYRGETVGKPGVSFRYASYPCTLGHEVSGIVTDVGSGVKKLQVGDRVTGVAYRASGFATHVVEPEEFWLRVPRAVPLEHALGEPLMAVTNIIRLAAPDFGDFVLIAGDGFMSLLTVAALARYPLRALVMVGHHDNRLAIAREFGADHVINSKQEDPYWEVRRLVDGLGRQHTTPWLGGVDIAFDFTGKMAGLQLCASLCKPKQRAKLMMAGFYDREAFPLGHYLINRGMTLMPCFPAQSKNIVDDLRRAVWALQANLFPIGQLITHIFTLDQVALAMEQASSRTDGYIKGIVVPDPCKLECRKYRETHP